MTDFNLDDFQKLRVGTKVRDGSFVNSKTGEAVTLYKQECGVFEGDSAFMDRLELRVPSMKGIAPGIYLITKPVRVYKGKAELSLRPDALKLLEAA